MNTALLLSGGVDSSVALHLLMEQGIRPDLYYIQIGADNEGYTDCPSEDDEVMVQLLARRYGLKLSMVNLHQEYWDYVVRYMIDTVRAGRTPHPDMLCNRVIKFGFFNEYWGKDYDHIATGHYADKLVRDGKHFLTTAVDPLKDQTDFLAQITYPQLVKAQFPLGRLPKSEVRQIAERERLVTAHRRDSQGICFLGKVNYNDFVRRHLGTRIGDIVDNETGQVIGEHEGYWFHTIGQRKGLGLSGGPWFVTRKDIEHNILYVSRGYDPEEQYGNVIEMGVMNFITESPFGDAENGTSELEVTFKVRHTPDFSRGRLVRATDTTGTILHSDELIQGIAPGQFCTIYDRDSKICYGSGVIACGWKNNP